jgi:hypothetical protein
MNWASLTGYVPATIYFGWENQEDNHNRQLYSFKSHMQYLQWLAKTEGLREWNAGARYAARPSEVEAYNANMIISYGGERVSK